MFVECHARKHLVMICTFAQLSGQLRLRLQYAKLKVEHGWVRRSVPLLPIHSDNNTMDSATTNPLRGRESLLQTHPPHAAVPSHLSWRSSEWSYIVLQQPFFHLSPTREPPLFFRFEYTEWFNTTLMRSWECWVEHDLAIEQ